ncbi:MAG TPA: hypothetical protein VMQ10_03505 [Spirochaetia bacterium]|nr:hypothetical protein [Spirochaetia bacterium]
MEAEDLLARLRAFALRSKSPTIDVNGFIRSLAGEDLPAREVEAGIRDLAFRGDISAVTDWGRLAAVTLPDFPVFALSEEYRRLQDDPSLPFPREETLAVPISPSELVAMEAKGQLGELLDAASEKPQGAVKLLFPENVPPMVVPRAGVNTDLIEAAVSRISRYLQDPRNAALTESKLLGAFKGNEGLVRQALEDILLRPRKATSTVMSPTDFSFRFWSHLSNKLTADVGAKTERTDQDQALLQSACLVAYASFHQKGAAEREKERAADRKHLETLVRRPPYVFSSADLFELKDPNGALLVTKHGPPFIVSFLEDATRAPDDGSLPFFVPVHSAAQKKDYYVQRDFIVPVFLKMLGDAGDALRSAYLQEWVEQMREDAPPETCRDDERFRRDVEQRVRAEFPVIPALFHVPLLRLAAEVPSLGAEARTDLERCFSRLDALRPLVTLLGLSRSKLYREARSYLPFWKTAPVIGAIARFLRRLLRPRPAQQARQSGPRISQLSVEALAAGGQAADGGAAPRTLTEKQQMEHFRSTLRGLERHYVAAGSTVERTLQDLAERWNPLIDAGPKQDLVRDVNALTRDFLRPIRRTLVAQPPDTSRITALAEQLAASRSLAQIGNREVLLRYLELYMLQVLLAS